jgi:hypothetical protein
MEEPLDTFLAKCGDPTIEFFRVRFPHPFLFRELPLGAESRKPTSEEIQERTNRFARIMKSGGAGDVLSEYGAPNVRSLLGDVSVAAARTVEQRVVRLVRRDRGWPVTIGRGPGADLVLGTEPVAEVACSIEPTSHDASEFTIDVRGEGVGYDGERLPPGSRVRLEEGRVLELGPETSFHTFSSSGLVHFLAFRAALAAVKGGG